ncbi:MAG: septum site-determining protein MinC [Sporolactobacillus sp.]
MSASMSPVQPLVTLKGRKDGLVLVMDESCAFDALLGELKDKLMVNHQLYNEGPMISVKVQAGNRYLSPSQRDELLSVVRSFDHLQVEQIESNVMTIKEFEEKQSREKIVPVSQIVRSGQVLSVEGDLLLIGDVNPGGTITATGNIYILGSLRGIACAGTLDKHTQAIIAASVMEASQLRIGPWISRADDQVHGTLPDDHLMECAYADENQGKIVVDKIQNVIKTQNLSLLLTRP